MEARCQRIQHGPKSYGGLNIGVPGGGSGSGRLWRVAGAGGFEKYRHWDELNSAADTPTPVKLFHCYSTLVPEFIRTGGIRYVH